MHSLHMPFCITDNKIKIGICVHKGDTGATGPQGPAGETGPQGPAGQDAPQIDDTQASASNPWSGAKVAAEIAKVKPSQGLIADVTVSEDTAELVIDTDTNGDPFELTDMLMELRTAAGSGSGYVTCMAYMGYPHDGWRYLPTQTAISTYGNWETIYMTMRIGGAMFFCATTSRENGGTANNLSPFAYLFEDTNIKKVRFTRYNSESPLIPAGTRVKIYGVRA